MEREFRVQGRAVWFHYQRKIPRKEVHLSKLPLSTFTLFCRYVSCFKRFRRLNVNITRFSWDDYEANKGKRRRKGAGDAQISRMKCL